MAPIDIRGISLCLVVVALMSGCIFGGGTDGRDAGAASDDASGQSPDAGRDAGTDVGTPPLSVVLVVQNPNDVQGSDAAVLDWLEALFGDTVDAVAASGATPEGVDVVVIPPRSAREDVGTDVTENYAELEVPLLLMDVLLSDDFGLRGGLEDDSDTAYVVDSDHPIVQHAGLSRDAVDLAGQRNEPNRCVTGLPPAAQSLARPAENPDCHSVFVLPGNSDRTFGQRLDATRAAYLVHADSSAIYRTDDGDALMKATLEWLAGRL